MYTAGDAKVRLQPTQYASRAPNLQPLARQNGSFAILCFLVTDVISSNFTEVRQPLKASSMVALRKVAKVLQALITPPEPANATRSSDGRGRRGV